MRARKTCVAIDEDLLAAAREALETTTVKDTVERAFLEVLGNRARREEVEALATLRGMDLDDADVMSRAWRS